MADTKRKSKKHSRSKSPKPLKGFTLYLCNNIDYDDAANALTKAGIRHKRHRDFFTGSTDDTILLQKVGKKKWILITADKRQRTRMLERKAIEQFKVREFAFTSAQVGDVFGDWVGHDVPMPDLDLIIQWVQNCSSPPVVFIDGLIAFLDGNENDAKDVRAFFTRLYRLRQLGAAIVILHHTGKAGSAQQFRGSSDIKAAIDVGYLLVNHGGARLTNLSLNSFKSRFAVTEPIAIIYTDGEFTNQDREQQAEQVFYQLLFENSGITKDFEKLALSKQLPRTAARDFIDRGIADGSVIVRRGDGNTHCLFLTCRTSIDTMISNLNAKDP